MSQVTGERDFLPVNIAVLTVSDSRTPSDDKSGDTLVDRLEAAGHKLADRAIVKDEVAAITAKLKQWIEDAEVDVVISTGGTGVTGRDVTPEAFAQVYDKEIAGFGELFRMLSYEKIGTSTIQSRASSSARVSASKWAESTTSMPSSCITRRNRELESNITAAWLGRLGRCYEELFDRWDCCPVLRLDCSQYDLRQRSDVEMVAAVMENLLCCSK